MKLYKYLMLVSLLGIVATGANASSSTPIDPTIILRGGGGSIPVENRMFDGVFPNPDSSNCNANCIEYHNADFSEATFTGIHLFFTSSGPVLPLAYSCDNSNDPFFTNCGVSGNEVTFSGLTNNFFSDFSAFFAPSNNCDGDCRGIQFGNHFQLAISGLPALDQASFHGVADTATSNTPEPASSLLFVIAMGAIALFLKRRNNLIAA